MKRNIIVLGGGYDQIGLIQSIRETDKDAYIILVDYFANPIAKSYADIHIQESTLDYDVVLALAKKYEIYKIITACTDQALLTMAYVSEELGIPCYISYKQALELTNKLYMKEKMVRDSIPTSKHLCVKEGDHVDTSGLRFPLVVKPVDANSSKGITKITKVEELDNAMAEAYSYSKTKVAIVEEFVEGEELSVDVFVENGVAKLLSVSTSLKVKSNFKNFTILHSEFPPTIPYDPEVITCIAQQIADSFSLKDAPLLIQMIVGNGIYSVIDFSARMGGGTKYKLIHTVSGVDIMTEYVRLVYGKPFSVNPAKACERARMTYLYCNNGTYASLDNFDSLKEENVIEDYFVYKQAPSTVTKAENSSDRIAGIMLKADSLDEINAKSEKAISTLRILNEEGDDMLKREFYQ